MMIWTDCAWVKVVTVSEIYYLGYFQVKYNIKNIAEAFYMNEVLSLIFLYGNFLSGTFPSFSLSNAVTITRYFVPYIFD